MSLVASQGFRVMRESCLYICVLLKSELEIERENRPWVERARHVDTGRIPVETLEADEGRAKVGSDSLQEHPQWDPAPASYLAPPLDADMARDLLGLGQRAQRCDRPGSLFGNESRHIETPIVWNAAHLPFRIIRVERNGRVTALGE